MDLENKQVDIRNTPEQKEIFNVDFDGWITKLI